MKTHAKILALCALALGTGLLTTVGAAQPDRWQPLREDPVITQGLTVIAVGRHIHFNCPDISARMLRSFTYAEGLYNHARGLGYTRSQVTAYVDDRTEQARYREIARAYFAERGADMADPAGVCRVGRDEITAGSQIGRLLRQG